MSGARLRLDRSTPQGVDLPTDAFRTGDAALPLPDHEGLLESGARLVLRRSFHGSTVARPRSGQLLDQVGSYRVDSLIVAIAQALQKKPNLSVPERVVVSVEALEREVNNGGYNRFFFNGGEAGSLRR